MKKKKRVGILTSGGDSPGMNAAIRAAARNCLYHGFEPYGIFRGFEGLIEDDMRLLESSSVSDILYKGGTILRTARSLKFMTPYGMELALENLKKHEIEDVIVIGGDGSFKGGIALSDKGINVMAIPGTIDNDLAYTDYTIGFDTAVSTVTSALGNVRDTSSSHERATIVEVMGRKCGDIAIYAGLASGAESVLVPEIPFDMEDICRRVTQGRKRGKLHNLIIKAEGVEIDSWELAERISTRTGMETKVVVLGYIQRGGTPTVNDRIMAAKMAGKAVSIISLGKERNQAIGIKNGSIFSVPLADAVAEENTIKEDEMLLIDILNT